MKRTTRNALAAALTAAVVVGVTARAAHAAPKGKPAHVKVQAEITATSASIPVDRRTPSR